MKVSQFIILNSCIIAEDKLEEFNKRLAELEKRVSMNSNVAAVSSSGSGIDLSKL